MSETDLGFVEHVVKVVISMNQTKISKIIFVLEDGSNVEVPYSTKELECALRFDERE
jgi:hypothetical protein